MQFVWTVRLSAMLQLDSCSLSRRVQARTRVIRTGPALRTRSYGKHTLASQQGTALSQAAGQEGRDCECEAISTAGACGCETLFTAGHSRHLRKGRTSNAEDSQGLSEGHRTDGEGFNTATGG